MRSDSLLAPSYHISLLNLHSQIKFLNVFEPSELSQPFPPVNFVSYIHRHSQNSSIGQISYH